MHPFFQGTPRERFSWRDCTGVVMRYARNLLAVPRTNEICRELPASTGPAKLLVWENTTRKFPRSSLQIFCLQRAPLTNRGGRFCSHSKLPRLRASTRCARGARCARSILFQNIVTSASPITVVCIIAVACRCLTLLQYTPYEPQNSKK